MPNLGVVGKVLGKVASVHVVSASLLDRSWPFLALALAGLLLDPVVVLDVGDSRRRGRDGRVPAALHECALNRGCSLDLASVDDAGWQCTRSDVRCVSTLGSDGRAVAELLRALPAGIGSGPLRTTLVEGDYLGEAAKIVGNALLALDTGWLLHNRGSASVL